MVSLVSERGYVGAINDPETGERIHLPADVSADTAERLTQEFAHLTVTGVTDYPTNEDGEPLCVGKDGGQCSRTVDEPNGLCWQHEA